ncbi:MAG TPA: zf-HC2 domain-containing protein [Pyrinomonadaceae bacterium]
MKALEREGFCSHAGDMLGYLYDEISAADRAAFELHLADCGTCIDDFAELSQSRYPVYEWKQIDFDPLQTPTIVISYQTETASMIARLWDLLAPGRGFAVAGAAAAVLVALMTGYFLLGRQDVTNDLAAVDPTSSPEKFAVVPSPSKTVEERSEDMPGAIERVPVKKQVETRPVEPVKASTRQIPKAANPRRPGQTVRRSDPIPVLSTADDFEDDSLRLADLFEDIDTSE